MDQSSPDLVKDVRCLHACVQRLRNANDAVVFWNGSREFRIMLRNDPDDAATVSFEVCIVPDDDDTGQALKRVNRVLELEHDGVFDDGDSTFVMEAYSLDADDLAKDPRLLDKAMARLNEIYKFTICGCGAYFIKDAAPTCVFCQLTEDSISSAQHFCAICHDSSTSRHMRLQACCGQMLHTTCLATWEATSSSKKCPLCRHAV